MPTALAYKQHDIRDEADQQNYGNIPRSVFRALHHAGLSPAARSVYLLHWFGGRAAGTWTTKLTVTQIAAELDMAPSTVKAAHRSLEKEGWICRTEQPRFRHDPFRSPPAITEVLIPKAFQRDVLNAGKRTTRAAGLEHDSEAQSRNTNQACTDQHGDQPSWQLPTGSPPANPARKRRNPAAPTAPEKDLWTSPPTDAILTALLSRLDSEDRKLVQRWALRSAIKRGAPFPKLSCTDAALSERIQECFNAGCVEQIQPDCEELADNSSIPLDGIGHRRTDRPRVLARRPDLAKARALIYQAAKEAGVDPEIHWASVQQAFMDRASWFHRNQITDLASISRIAAAKIRKLEWRVQSSFSQGRK